MAERRRGRLGVVVGLGLTETLAWASSYYLPAILARPIAASLALPAGAVFATVSAALLIAALLGPRIGRIIDAQGGRGVLAASNLLLAAGLLLLAAAHGLLGLALAWAVLGVGIACGLYDAAFAALTALYGDEARGPITGITLFAGFASTLGWPFSAYLAAHFGWRGACLGWAALHLGFGLPLNLTVSPPGAPHGGRQRARAGRRQIEWRGVALAYVFAAAWFVTGAMATHMPRLLILAHVREARAIAAATLVGPAQVLARILEFVFLRRVHPLVSTRIATLLHPLGALLLACGGPVMAAPFALLYGAGNGILTIARGTLPLALFGPEGYGERTGWIGAPARATQALSPFLFSLALEQWGLAALWLSAGLCLSASLALFLLRAAPRHAE
jgi:predicted MFS family arabinose efflux permease